ncbi:MAG: hypothetical protein GY950_21580 [bacterium]|nr:hypothetical protein [bacterium]
MKVKIIITTLFAILFLVVNFSYGADSIAGTYSAFSGKLILVFQDNGHTVLKDNNGNIGAKGKYTVKRDKIILTDESGPISCSGDAKTGKYKWALDGDKLTFTLVEDKCGGRKGALTVEPWIRKKESK